MKANVKTKQQQSSNKYSNHVVYLLVTIKLLHNQKKRKDKTERVKGSWLETHTIHSVTYIYLFSNFFMDRVACIASSKSDNDLLF